MFNPSDFIDKFKEEADERLQRLNEEYINLEADPTNEESLAVLLREAHTLKGSAKMVGLQTVSTLAHALEDLLVGIRDGVMRPGGDVSEAVFSILDAMLMLAEKGDDKDFDAVPLLDSVKEIMMRAGRSQSTPASSSSSTRRDTNENRAAEPPLDEAKAECSSPENGSESKVNGNGKGEEGKVHQLDTIRVKSAKVDEILNLAGELVIYQNKTNGRAQNFKRLEKRVHEVLDLWRQLENALDGEREANPYLKTQLETLASALTSLKEMSDLIATSFYEDASRVDVLLHDLHEAAMDIRMLPASYIFSTLPRAVRDLARAFGKEIDLVIEGEETRLDKRVLEEINDPLIHLFRNAVDHGIETPEEREALGKPRRGTIKVEAAHEGDRIILRVSDDGRGIDPEKVKLSAIKKGIITRAEAESMTDQEAVYLIFKPGFSTAATVSDISGRGVGLDVVKLNVETNLRGHIQVESEPGKGTTFTLTLPLTLAIIRALLVRVRSEIFAIPTTSIEETVILSDDMLFRVGDQSILRLRGKNLPLSDIGAVLGVGSTAEGHVTGKPAIVVGVAGDRHAYVVDELIGEQPIVIKPLSSLLKKVPNIAGATILGDGRLVLILNMSDLVRNSKGRAAPVIESSEQPQRTPSSAPTKNERKRVLVVEDSLTTRELEASMLRAAGYDVDAARDGLEALELLARKTFDLVVTDLQMPRMDGFAFMKRLRADRRFKDIPVIVVSSLGSEEDKLKGLELGADGYFAKRHFDQEGLLDLVGKLVK